MALDRRLGHLASKVSWQIQNNDSQVPAQMLERLQSLQAMLLGAIAATECLRRLAAVSFADSGTRLDASPTHPLFSNSCVTKKMTAKLFSSSV